MENARSRAKSLAKTHLANGDPTGWFEKLYALAQGDEKQIPWADLKPNPNLLGWLEKEKRPAWKRALTVGCGLGDDAEELARRGNKVSAFDVSKTAVEWCGRRFPKSSVEYRVADLLHPPLEWRRKFDFVFECYTLQVLRPTLRRFAVARLAEFLTPGGTLLVICRGRADSEPEGDMPWPLTKTELQRLTSGAGLREVAFEDFFDQETPPVRRFRAEYVRP